MNRRILKSGGDNYIRLVLPRRKKRVLPKGGGIVTVFVPLSGVPVDRQKISPPARTAAVMRTPSNRAFIRQSDSARPAKNLAVQTVAGMDTKTTKNHAQSTTVARVSVPRGLCDPAQA